MSEDLTREDTKNDKKRKKRSAFSADSSLYQPVVPKSQEVRDHEARVAKEAARQQAEEARKKLRRAESEPENDAADQKSAHAYQDTSATEALRTPPAAASDDILRPLHSEQKVEDEAVDHKPADEEHEIAGELDKAIEAYLADVEQGVPPEAAEEEVIKQYHLEDAEVEAERQLAENPELSALLDQKYEELDGVLPEDETALSDVAAEMISKLEKYLQQASTESDAAQKAPDQTASGAGDDATEHVSPPDDRHRQYDSHPDDPVPPVPPSGGGWGGGPPDGTDFWRHGSGSGESGSAAFADQAVPDVRTAEKTRVRGKVISAGLLGGLIGYYFGNKAGRRKQAAEMQPEHARLQKDNHALQDEVARGRTRIQSLRKIQAEATINQHDVQRHEQTPDTPLLANGRSGTQPAPASETAPIEQPGESKPVTTPEIAAVPISDVPTEATRAFQSHDANTVETRQQASTEPSGTANVDTAMQSADVITAPQPEQVVPVRQQEAGAVYHEAPEQTFVRPEAAPLEERLSQSSIDVREAVVKMPVPELLVAAEKIDVDGQSVKQLYEQGRLDKEDLRDIVYERAAGGNPERKVIERLQPVKSSEAMERLPREGAHSSSAFDSGASGGSGLPPVQTASEDTAQGAHGNSVPHASQQNTPAAEQHKQKDYKKLIIWTTAAVVVGAASVMLFL